MFKKPAEVRTYQRLSGADRKKLRRATKEKFPRASDEDIDSIFPPKAEVTVAKYPNRVHVYGIEGELPMLIDVDGRGKEIYPTVYALWKAPDLLPAFVLKGGEVSHYILGGADLMFPGVQVPNEGLPTFLAGEPWSVKVPGNSAPIAVGSTYLSSTEALNAGLRGKALRIVHHYGDSLWKSAEGRYVPNAGFLEEIVIEDPTFSSSLNLHSTSKEESDGTYTVIQVEEELVETSDGHTNGTNILSSSDLSNDGYLAVGISELTVEENETIEETEENGPVGETEGNLPIENIDEKEQHDLTVEEVDVLLDKCLLQALHTSVKEKDLPLLISTLWSNHILPCRPPGTMLDIKKSAHKKLSKWLQSKASTGLVVVKEEKYKKELVLQSINRRHPDYTSFTPERWTQETVDQKQDTAVDESSGSNTQFDVAEVYKPSTHVNAIFVAVGAEPSRYYSASEASEVVFRYVEKENLVKHTDKAVVVLDVTLCDALFKGAIKKGSAYPTEIHKKDLGSAFLKRMQVHHCVSRGTDVVVRKGAVRPVQILTERRQGNKKVTRVSGMETFLVDAHSLASELQIKFACSTSVTEVPGKKEQHEVLVQGAVIDNIAKHLVDHYGIPKRHIEVYDKTRR